MKTKMLGYLLLAATVVGVVVSVSTNRPERNGLDRDGLRNALSMVMSQRADAISGDSSTVQDGRFREVLENLDSASSPVSSAARSVSIQMEGRSKALRSGDEVKRKWESQYADDLAILEEQLKLELR